MACSFSDTSRKTAVNGQFYRRRRGHMFFKTQSNFQERNRGGKVRDNKVNVALSHFSFFFSF